MNSFTPETPVGKMICDARILAVLVIDEVEAAVPVAESKKVYFPDPSH